MMLGTDKSRGYCLEMICADFLAGASLEAGAESTLVFGARSVNQRSSRGAEAAIVGRSEEHH